MHRYRLEVAQIIENFLNGTGGRWDWDDFISRTIDDPELDQIARRCDALSEEFPPEQSGHYCGAAGFEVMRGYFQQLRQPSAHQTLVSDPTELRVISSQLHDWWFSLRTLVRAERDVSIPLWHEKMRGRWFGGFHSSPKMPAGAWAVMRIAEVESVEVADTAGIDTHTLSDLRFDASSRTLTLVSGFPLVCRLVVERLAIALKREGDI